ncbi:MAG: hypothetical protein U9R54_02055 [Bacteroidota bacterium]|nr:hypothetical protein [Bacteroidota bacterium]
MERSTMLVTTATGGVQPRVAVMPTTATSITITPLSIAITTISRTAFLCVALGT